MLNTTTFIINSPLEQFEVSSFIGITAPLLGYFHLSLTNLGFYTLLVLSLALGLHFMASNNKKLIASRWSISLESAYASISALVKEQIGSANERFLPLIYTLFFFIILANLTGNIPYNFTVTTSMIVALGLSFTIFIAVTIMGLEIHGLHWFSYFVPAGTPLGLVPALILIELISYIARAFSLGIRLFSNMVAGHTLLHILSSFLYKLFTSGLILFFVTLIPFAIFIALIGLEIAVSVIQAYVFCILTCSYIKDAIDLH